MDKPFRSAAFGWLCAGLALFGVSVVAWGQFGQGVPSGFDPPPAVSGKPGVPSGLEPVEPPKPGGKQM